ncbi:SAGA HAT/Core module component [Komagataella phaffii CBS 7435]|uniref:SaGa associated Factor 29kDa n=2 Tax=Komagataella phaffii TaxID=460519 RepID=C4QX57_KOMPG|nr:SaGa associated Factor 29kDa [Komagataella phaffii GS115]AOA60378.1 GQ67_02193T0 [Komagataella phaffii]CAH2446632.1 SAGA HAT/Core module component [Komagataella phaffii CBS 7435]AOA65640.1 GQ68_02208T0 [Komagataella phaffii GS115]CAY67830.1 SaGa associated Factor 29kDa [Komagataella phaffii GS115]SCV11850.1 SAGA HAT/Core module component [Komagataella phaffii CBS 7435]
MESSWDVVISQLQDICSSNKTCSFDLLYETDEVSSKHEVKDLGEYQEQLQSHKHNIDKSLNLIKETLNDVSTLAVSKQIRKSEAKQKVGRSFHHSKYNPSEPIIIGSQVAFKLRQKGKGEDEEWIQCEVIKIIGDGTRFEIRDPEPDENNTIQIFKTNWKDIIMIPTQKEAQNLPIYPNGFKVLARYPETTTFYLAVVSGSRRDGTCRLRFDGEEEVDKETEVERRLVLPFPGR